MHPLCHGNYGTEKCEHNCGFIDFLDCKAEMEGITMEEIALRNMKARNTPPPPSGKDKKSEDVVPKRNLPVYKRARFCPGCKMLGEWVILGHSWYFNCKFCGYWDREEHPKF